MPAAKEFLARHRLPIPEPGREGARWLADWIEGLFEEDAAILDDHRLVEGAGAILGLLLIEHLDGEVCQQEDRHRVRLGRFGWFDPFATIEAVLDSEEPRSSLRDHLAAAEEEAERRGPISRVVGAFADALAKARPDVSIRTQFELTVELSNGATVDLTRLGRIREDDVALRKAAMRVVQMLPGGDKPALTSWVEAAPRILPRLVPETFLSSLPDRQDLYCTALGHDVYLALQLRYGPRARYVRDGEAASWKAQGAFVERHALSNLAQKSRKLRLEQVGDGLYRLRQGDGLDAARLLLPDLGVRLTRLDPREWIVVAPHRDVLLLAPSSPDHVRRLIDHAKEAAGRAPHPVSTSPFRLLPTGVQPYPLA